MPGSRSPAGPKGALGRGQRAFAQAGFGAAAVVFAAGCALSAGTRAEPETPNALNAEDAPKRILAPPKTLEPVSDPPRAVSRPDVGEPSETLELLANDPIVGSSAADSAVIRADIGRWSAYWRDPRNHDGFLDAIARMGKYMHFVDDEIELRGLPRSLRYLPLVESYYNTTAVSPAGAGGIWQFMPATARWLGLEVGMVDERLDPWISGPIALDYINQLHSNFDSWFLTLAAYNLGVGRVGRLLRRAGVSPPYSDEDFLKIRSLVPRETRDFVPKLIAVARTKIELEVESEESLEYDAREHFDEAEVTGPATLDVVADVAGTDIEVVRALNAHVRRGFVPFGVETKLRLPKDAGEGFEEAFAALDQEDRYSVIQYRVRPGDTMYDLARRFKLPLRDLRRWNPGVRPERLQIGQLLIVGAGS